MVRQIVDAAADLQIKMASTAMQAPGKARAGLGVVRQRGVAPALGAAAGGVLRTSSAVLTMPFELADRLRHRGRPATPPTPVYTPAATEAGAPGTATAAVEAEVRAAAAREAVRTGTSVDEVETVAPEKDDLALPDFDHMTLGSLRSRLGKLSLEELLELRAYEQAHADRLAVVTMLENRIAKLRREQLA